MTIQRFLVHGKDLVDLFMAVCVCSAKDGLPANFVLRTRVRHSVNITVGHHFGWS